MNSYNLWSLVWRSLAIGLLTLLIALAFPVTLTYQVPLLALIGSWIAILIIVAVGK